MESKYTRKEHVEKGSFAEPGILPLSNIFLMWNFCTAMSVSDFLLLISGTVEADRVWLFSRRVESNFSSDPLSLVSDMREMSFFWIFFRIEEVGGPMLDIQSEMTDRLKIEFALQAKIEI